MHSTPHPDRAGTYLIVASAHNVPALESCLQSQCTQAIIIATPQTENDARNLQTLLREEGVAVEVMSGMNGEDIEHSHQWIAQTLLPLLRSRPGPWRLNLNGGTKTMALLLATCWPWDSIDYQAFVQGQSAPVQRFTLNGQGRLQHLEHLRTSLPPLSPIKLLRTYCSHVERGQSRHPAAPQASALARELLQAHQDRQGHPWWVIAELCGKHWLGLDKKRPSAPIAIASLQHSLAQHGLTAAQLQDWLNQTANQLGDANLWAAEAGHFSIPPDKRPAQWLRGGWLEHWAQDVIDHHRATHPQGPALQYEVNLKPTRGKGDAREIDVISRCAHGPLHVLELKVDVPGSTALKDIMNQTETLSPLVGKGQLGLGVTPALLMNLRDEKRQLFEQRCKDKHIALIQLRGAADLLNWLASEHAS